MSSTEYSTVSPTSSSTTEYSTITTNSEIYTITSLNPQNSQDSHEQPVNELNSSEYNNKLHTLEFFLKQVDPENWSFFCNVFSACNFTVNDIMIMKCCQLSAIMYAKDMFLAVRFWNKLDNFKQSNMAYIQSTTEQPIPDLSCDENIKLLNIIDWGIKEGLRGAIFLKGLFGSNTCQGLLSSRQSDLTNIILRFVNDQNLKASDQLFLNLADQIAENYPGESKEAYYKITVVNNSTTKTGKLYNKKYNINRKKPTEKNGSQNISENTIKSLFFLFEPGKFILLKSFFKK